jgi:hypothetical protein
VWSTLYATPKISTVEMIETSWVGQAHIPGHREAVTLSVALTPGEVRIGMILPHSIVQSDGNDLRDSISMALGPHRADVIAVRPGGHLLFDWHFHESPFTPEWIAQAMRSQAHLDILAHRLNYLTATIWRGVIEVIATAGRFDLSHDLLITTAQELPTLQVVREIPCVVYDTICDENAGRWLTILRSSLDENGMTQALERIGIEATVREMTQVIHV